METKTPSPMRNNAGEMREDDADLNPLLPYPLLDTTYLLFQFANLVTDNLLSGKS
jgi:hypothetical protein